ncbi:MAG: sugar phosphate isomerase/epimerase family protein [Eubacteriales bacterium]|nr:sugar phosphate isomerase/epimerase family protein [Eubacteriales bacterium]
MLKIGLDTESLHLWFQNRRMDIFGFIEKAHEFGLDGVMINLIKDYNLDPEWGTLESNDPAHLSRVRALLEKYNMYVELATRGIEYGHLMKVLDVADALGADIIRTYIPITLNSPQERRTGGEGKYDLGKIRLDFDPAVFDQAVETLRLIIPELQKRRIKIGLENHEYETSAELVSVVRKLNSPWIGLHYDFGNSMMAWEEPELAARNMAPYTVTTHFKDHIVIPCPEDKYGYVVCGIPAGKGNLDLKKLLKIILDGSAITRLNVEMCYPYCAQFKRTPGAGGVSQVGEGCFKTEQPPFDPKVIAPSEYYYPQEVSRELLEEFLKKQMDGARASAEYAKQLCREYAK